LSEYAWYDENSDRKTHPVGEKKPNELGIHDMSGNVWEWCLDVAYREYAEDRQTNPIYIGEVRDIYETDDADIYSSGSDRVLRGGSWRLGARICRSASRPGNSPDYRDYFLGFRLLRTP